MLKHIDDRNELRQTLLSLLSTSGTLAGISLALVGIVNLKIKIINTSIESMADDLFLFASLGFVVVCYLTFFALRRLHTNRQAHRWINIIDVAFLCSLTLLLFAGFATVYEFL